ncbi:MAG: DUF5655 domain-containing protein [Phenylobacterium sp.]
MSDVEAVFAGKDAIALATYGALVAALKPFGPFVEEAKKTSIHLARKSAFGGVHPRKAAILLVIRTSQPIESPRIRKLERVSANRWHNEMLLSAPDDLDGEVLGWLRAAYDLSGA